MTRNIVVLDQITHRNPCSESWETMSGGDWVRHCGKCDQSVYNLSALTRAEAERLLRNRGNSICTAFYRRPDGTLLTQQCPSSIRRSWAGVAALLAGLGLALPADAHPGGSCPTSRASIKHGPRAGQSASIEIVVMDASGAVIPASSVTLLRDGGAFRFETNERGQVSQADIEPGLYELKVDCPGFRSLHEKAVELRAGQQYRIDITLEIGSVGGNASYHPSPLDTPTLRPLRSIWRLVSQIWT